MLFRNAKVVVIKKIAINSPNHNQGAFNETRLGI